jgi:hypothetical protein
VGVGHRGFHIGGPGQLRHRADVVPGFEQVWNELWVGESGGGAGFNPFVSFSRRIILLNSRFPHG